MELPWDWPSYDSPALRDYVKVHRLNLVFLFEIKLSCTEKINLLARKLGFYNLEFVPPRGRAGGLLLLWDAFKP